MKSQIESFENTKRKAVLCSIHKQNEEQECLISLEELRRLLETAGGESVAFVTQLKEKADNAYFFGTGKLAEMAQLAQSLDADLIIVDDELSPIQIKNIEDVTGIETIDRSMLILDIFALHASSAEGRLQVELAQLKYTAPRLQGKNKHLSRLGGGIGTRGPGESKLEIDRRRTREKIAILEERLDNLERTRFVIRQNREKNGTKKCAIVGYTNAGKSTLLNYLTHADVYAHDQLFATLDPTTRLLTLPDDSSVFLTDTVGFIHKLPHHLIKAFKSTLDEACLADILLILCDVSDANFLMELQVTESLLDELGAKNKPILYVFNKCDQVEDKRILEEVRLSTSSVADHVIFISAKTGAGMNALLSKLMVLVHEGKERVTLRFPMNETYHISSIYSSADDVHVKYLDSFALVDGLLDEKTRNRFHSYLIHKGFMCEDDEK